MDKKKIVVEVLFVLILIFFLYPYMFGLFGMNSYVVISSSMSHSDSTMLYEFMDTTELPLKNGFNIGDVVLVKPAPAYLVGDVVAYENDGATAVRTHRIISMNKTHIITMGDRDMTQENIENLDPNDIESINLKTVEGKVVSRVPKLGVVKLIGFCSTSDWCSVRDCIFKKLCGATKIS